MAINNVGSVFLAASLDHWCSVYDAGDGGGGTGEAIDYCAGPVDQRNATLCEQLKQNSIPLDEDGKVTIIHHELSDIIIFLNEKITTFF